MEGKINMEKLTNHQKIIVLMSREPTKFFFPYDFMRDDLGQLFVGYMADRRLRELKAEYPDIFEVKQQGKYTTCRLRMENIKDWYYTLPNHLRAVLRVEGHEPSESAEEGLARLNLEFADDQRR